MKEFILTQATKQHNVNVLHDAFNTAGISPVRAESTATESRFGFADNVTNAAIQAVVDAYTYSAPSSPADLKALAQNFRAAINNATTVAAIKAALNQELMLLLRAIAQRDVRDL